GEGANRRLGGDEEPALVEMVGRVAGQGQQQELRPELQRHDQADRKCVVVGELGEHQPVLARPLHPGADVGDEGAGRPDPIVVPFQGPEDARKGRPHGASYSVKCTDVAFAFPSSRAEPPPSTSLGVNSTRRSRGTSFCRCINKNRSLHYASLREAPVGMTGPLTKGDAMGLPRRGMLHFAAGAATLPLLPSSAAAQAWPNRPVRWV